MGLDVTYVHVKTNDVLATSFSAMHGGKFRDGACAVRSRRGDALHLNETRPLLVTYGANSLWNQTKAG